MGMGTCMSMGREATAKGRETGTASVVIGEQAQLEAQLFGNASWSLMGHCATRCQKQQC